MKLWHATAYAAWALAPMLWLRWTIITALWRIVSASSNAIIEKVALQLLVSSLRVYVRNSCDFDTITWSLLLISILESVLVKVNRCRSKSLRCRLLYVAGQADFEP